MLDGTAWAPGPELMLPFSTILGVPTVLSVWMIGDALTARTLNVGRRSVKVMPVPEAVAAALSTAVVASVTLMMYEPAGMFVPVTNLPTSALVKASVADVMVVEAFVVTPSVATRVPSAAAMTAVPVNTFSASSLADS